MQYPAIDDDKPTGYPADESPWLRVWNSVTDLYRFMERTLDQVRASHSASEGAASVLQLFDVQLVPRNAVVDHVWSLYSALPAKLKITPRHTSNLSQDRCGFWAASIIATIQLLRMVLLSTEIERLSLSDKCDVTGQLVTSVFSIPTQYLRATSTPLLHHLAGIGSLLGSVIEGSMDEMSYARTRSILLSMADLLHSLEIGLSHAANTAARIRPLVDRVDQVVSNTTMRLLDWPAWSRHA